MNEKTLYLFAHYFQFYVQDETSSGIDGDSWTDEAVQGRLALEESAFAVRTARNMGVPVKIVVADAPPDLDLSLWDHAVEFSINVPSGRLVVAGCTDYFPDGERLFVEPGHYVARVLFGNLKALSEDGLEGEDHYRSDLWKGHPKTFTALKQQVDKI